jgi:membrane protease YdiL (CAAX protease family)
MAAAGPTRRLLVVEVVALTGLAVGLSALRSVLSFAQTLAAPARISAQTTTLNASRVPQYPWIDLGYQLVFIAGLALPAVLAAVLVLARGQSLADVGISTHRWRHRVALGVAVAAVVGGLGLAAYLTSYALGLSLAVVPTGLPPVWWRLPVLVLSAVANAVLEEVVLSGYLVHRIGQLGGRPAVAVGTSAAIRGFYHLYQGTAGLVGNLAMGLAFAGYFQRRRTVVPQVVAHATIDVVAFVGYLALAGRVDWLPG